MKNKILIGVLAVFVCGVLALTIPKKANASTFVNDTPANEFEGYSNDSISNLLAMEDNDYLSCSLVPKYDRFVVGVYDDVYVDVVIDKVVWDYWYMMGEYHIVNFGVYYYLEYINADGNEVFTDLCYVGAENFLAGGHEYISTYLTKDNYSSYKAVDSNIRYDLFFQYYYTEEDDFVFQTILDVYCGEEDDYTFNFVNEVVLYSEYYSHLTKLVYPEQINFAFSPNLLYVNYLYRHNMIPPLNPTYLDENVNFFDYIKTSTSGFLDTDIIGDLSLGDILLFVVSIGLLIFVLRFFAGG